LKVFAVQGTTTAIATRLQALVPGRPLNAWFTTIVEEGTGHRFEVADNDRWLAVARPVVEAFFHARYFLEMAVRYSHLDEPPRPLPSGYAALWYVFDLR
jgi:hypothetical protein